MVPNSTCHPWLRWLPLLVLVLIAGCSPEPRPTAQLPVYFTCDTRARLEPCGCFTGQYGGLTRLKTVLDAEGEGALRLDVGDAIGGKEDFDLLHYEYMLKAFAQMQYDALNIGHREAQLTAKQLQAIKQTSPVPILSANLLDKATGRPIFDPWHIIERNGIRAAVLGVVDPHGLEETLGQGLEVRSMESALVDCLAALKNRADVLILLAFTDEPGLAQLADRFYEIHVILGGRVRQPAQELTKRNRSALYFVTNESRALGSLRLHLAPGAAPVVSDGEILLLHDKIPQHDAIAQLARNYREELRRTKLAVDDPARIGADTIPGVRGQALYVGSERCGSCHAAATQVWKRSGHARAFATLVERRADADPKCIACHSVGFGSASGYRRAYGQSRLVDVGCESCHGPGSLHVRRWEGEESIGFVYRPLAAGDCQKCHYGEFSRPFDWDTFWPRIAHGKEPPAKP